jgi:hypothetical protein
VLARPLAHAKQLDFMIDTLPSTEVPLNRYNVAQLHYAL